MPIIYKVTIESSGKKNQFHITWLNVAANTEDSFDAPDTKITPEQLKKLWQKPRDQLAIGEKLFHFLDGDGRHLKRALDEAVRHGEPLQLHICSCSQAADWPFELLAQEGVFLLPNRLHLIRSVSNWGTEKKTPPQNRALKLLFMACSALDVQPVLDFEEEEESIFSITEGLTIDMEVEDSGSLDGLREQLERNHYDVVHLSGHADINKEGIPFFIMEDETGSRQDVLPDMLWDEALSENPPRLLFLSGCRTGDDDGAR